MGTPSLTGTCFACLNSLVALVCLIWTNLADPLSLFVLFHLDYPGQAIGSVGAPLHGKYMALLRDFTSVTAGNGSKTSF